jgi:hypothetical protein
LIDESEQSSTTVIGYFSFDARIYSLDIEFVEVMIKKYISIRPSPIFQEKLEKIEKRCGTTQCDNCVILSARKSVSKGDFAFSPDLSGKGEFEFNQRMKNTAKLFNSNHDINLK